MGNIQCSVNQVAKILGREFVKKNSIFEEEEKEGEEDSIFLHPLLFPFCHTYYI